MKWLKKMIRKLEKEINTNSTDKIKIRKGEANYAAFEKMKRNRIR